MIRRTLALVGVIATVVLFLAPAASAQYVDDGALTCDLTNVSAGDTLSCSTDPLFDPGTDGTWTFRSSPVVVGTSVADAAGRHSLTFTVPLGTEDGAHTVSVSGTAAGDPLTLTYSVTVGEGGGTAALPRTGSESGLMWRVAVGLVAVGAVLVLTTRKRAEVTVDA